MEPPAAPTVPRPKSPPRPEVPITTTPPVKRERRWSVAALCVVLAVLCGLGAAAAVTSASDRKQVLAVARDVPAGQALTAADLSVAEVSSDAALTPVPAADKAGVIGKRPAVDLRKGGLLTTSQLAGGTGLGDDQQQVGVQIKRGQAPAGTLAPGDKVLAVSTPAQGDEQAAKDDGPPSTIEAAVVSVSRPDASGTVVVNLAVAATDGPTLATRAAMGRIALVREPRSN
ncbi:SAF domain-containing protein [Streptomyces violaceusniger]|uniref:SAF domain protein n=1 Tax=Streptomyces violaceusniger (strain Tu 4113) TaxID=653045 RepID=G2PH65_STRV4|nr:SAF domain-containing protein [Streptomyces violaceusniger]AEM88711.1 SAF domain protein [Streptomyces violaceusniger Tu 4113]